MLEIDPNARYVESDPHLEVLCDQARYERRIGVDLEFIRQSTYFAKLALVQIAVGEQHLLIDPLGDVDLGPLESVMLDPGVCKVLHAPSQDLEIFFHRLGEPPRNIFDTQMAAAMAGLGHQASYSSLVSMVLGVELRHSEGFTDWLRRPLTGTQEAYALDDVRHLFALQERLTEQLEQMGRMSWFVEECSQYEELERYRTPPEELFTQVKSRNKLNPRGLAILRELAIWREEEAMRQDRPRRRVLLDEVLVEIARRAPSDVKTLKRVRELRIRDQGALNSLLDAVKRGQEVPRDDCPRPRRRTRVSRDPSLAVSMLKTAFKVQCDRQNIAPAMVGNASDIERLVRRYFDDPERSEGDPLLKGWRGDLVGGILLEILTGKVGLHLDPESGAPEFHELE